MGVVNFYTIDEEIVAEHPVGSPRVDYLCDALGSVSATVSSSVSIQNAYDYTPYGEVSWKFETAPVPAFQWLGTHGYKQAARPHSDVYVRNRHYSTLERRWTSVDPGREDETSEYTYAQSNPIAYNDPSGLSSSYCGPSGRKTLYSSCGNARLSKCKPTPQSTDCCGVEIRVKSAKAKFKMSLPRRRSTTMRYGTMTIDVVYRYIYTPESKDTPCPPEETDSKTVTIRTTSGKPRKQVYGKYWMNYAVTPPEKNIVGGKWHLCTRCLSPTKQGYHLGDEAFLFRLNPNTARNAHPKPGERLYRGGIEHHPDGPRPGTAGCVGCRTATGAKASRSCLEYIHDYGRREIPITIIYNPE